MAQIEVVLTAGKDDLNEVYVAIERHWVINGVPLDAGASVTGDETATPDVDWISWFVEGPVGASFTVKCIADGAERWIEAEEIGIGRPFKSGYRRI